MKCIPALLAAVLILSCDAPEVKQASSKPPVIKRPTPKETNPFAPVDVSPMDMSYYPVDYPIQKMQGNINTPPKARVIYSRPQRQGREVFGSLLKYGEPWRLGANEATEIEFFQDAYIQGKRVAKGRYIMYCIPEQNEWTLVFNTNTNSWGLKADPSRDAYRFRIPAVPTPTNIEHFTMAFENAGPDASLVLAWDHVMARLPIQF